MIGDSVNLVTLSAIYLWVYHTRPSKDFQNEQSKTMGGEEVILDLSMYQFNMYLMVQMQPCNESCPLLELAPAFWRDRAIERNSPPLHTERRRLSGQSYATPTYTLSRHRVRAPNGPKMHKPFGTSWPRSPARPCPKQRGR
ncbi:hypothetical protein BDN71DRAFT_1081864 [Pleurotus eryngii]|uniref:Uncharacterized protein n=1 Tax=Pleurotus eryngii TaxID=5323 RepID=A0A9P5ZXM5_PLEER|nr:hypothetical protein BDN71DRAFT_1081864 [Pleurotus eryngii]